MILSVSKSYDEFNKMCDLPLSEVYEYYLINQAFNHCNSESNIKKQDE